MSSVVVIKLGGSLFDLPDLNERLHELLRQVSSPALIVSGGGALADVVRDWDRVLGLGDETAHRLAIRTMALSAHFVASLSSQFVRVDSMAAIEQSWKQQAVPILDAVPWFLESHLLPHSWAVTSDSIAAAVTRQYPNAGLLLAKSVPLPDSGLTLEQAARRELVDDYFPIAADGLPITWCHFRADPIRLTPWRTG